ncbi:MAG: zf-TFIIB domain-containing protein [Octadecabacter sp.]|nr:zf-TFIIB domain-containing protein [Octadecabacter sp.]
MQCPIDGTTLVMSDRQGVEIDYCPQCRGVWLDRGELDKIIERSVPAPAPQAGQGRQAEYDAPSRPKKRGSFLDEIFDF